MRFVQKKTGKCLEGTCFGRTVANAGGVTQVSPARKGWEPNPKRAVYLSAELSPSLRPCGARGQTFGRGTSFHPITFQTHAGTEPFL
jgi:hypothetical protein